MLRLAAIVASGFFASGLEEPLQPVLTRDLVTVFANGTWRSTTDPGLSYTSRRQPANLRTQFVVSNLPAQLDDDGTFVSSLEWVATPVMAVMEYELLAESVPTVGAPLKGLQFYLRASEDASSAILTVQLWTGISKSREQEMQAAERICTGVGNLVPSSTVNLFWDGVRKGAHLYAIRLSNQRSFHTRFTHWSVSITCSNGTVCEVGATADVSRSTTTSEYGVRHLPGVWMGGTGRSGAPCWAMNRSLVLVSSVGSPMELHVCDEAYKWRGVNSIIDRYGASSASLAGLTSGYAPGKCRWLPMDVTAMVILAVSASASLAYLTWAVLMYVSLAVLGPSGKGRREPIAYSTTSCCGSRGSKSAPDCAPAPVTDDCLSTSVDADTSLHKSISHNSAGTGVTSGNQNGSLPAEPTTSELYFSHAPEMVKASLTVGLRNHKGFTPSVWLHLAGVVHLLKMAWDMYSRASDALAFLTTDFYYDIGAFDDFVPRGLFVVLVLETFAILVYEVCSFLWKLSWPRESLCHAGVVSQLIYGQGWTDYPNEAHRRLLKLRRPLRICAVIFIFPALLIARVFATFSGAILFGPVSTWFAYWLGSDALRDELVDGGNPQGKAGADYEPVSVLSQAWLWMVPSTIIQVYIMARLREEGLYPSASSAMALSSSIVTLVISATTVVPYTGTVLRRAYLSTCSSRSRLKSASSFS